MSGRKHECILLDVSAYWCWCGFATRIASEVRQHEEGPTVADAKPPAAHAAKGGGAHADAVGPDTTQPPEATQHASGGALAALEERFRAWKAGDWLNYGTSDEMAEDLIRDALAALAESEIACRMLDRSTGKLVDALREAEAKLAAQAEELRRVTEHVATLRELREYDAKAIRRVTEERDALREELAEAKRNIGGLVRGQQMYAECVTESDAKLSALETKCRDAAGIARVAFHAHLAGDDTVPNFTEMAAAVSKWLLTGEAGGEGK